MATAPILIVVYEVQDRHSLERYWVDGSVELQSGEVYTGQRKAIPEDEWNAPAF